MQLPQSSKLATLVSLGSCPAGRVRRSSPDYRSLAAQRHRCQAEATPSGLVDEEGQQGALDAARQFAEHALEQYNYKPADALADEEPLSLEGLRRRLQAVGRELQGISEEEYRRLSSAEASISGRRPTATPPLPESVLRELGMRLQSQSAARQNIVPLNLKPLAKQKITPEGTGAEVMLQGFNWESWKENWYGTLEAQADAIADLGFTVVWLPPPTDSVSPQGYMPGDLYNLNSKYGTMEQLTLAVRRLQGHGIKVLGDAVLNHRCAQQQDERGVWNRYGGRLAWDSRAIVGDDTNFNGRGNRSSGDLFAAAPNIDHSQDFVKRDLCEWLVWMRTHAGFDGWRLDFVKGFAGSHVKDYMEASVPQFAVGEYWDSMDYGWDGTPSVNQDAHRQRTVNWISAAGGLSTAFDITTKGIMHAVFERCEYHRLRDAAGKPPGLIGWWPSRAVTFLENHDTGSSQGHWRFPGHALEQGYAYILTHPGTPCVFWDHCFYDTRLGHAIQRLIALRRRHAIHCRSALRILAAAHDVYAAEIDERVIMKIGPGSWGPPDLSQYQVADCGNAWAVWERKAAAGDNSAQEA